MHLDTLLFNIATLICGVFVLDFGADKFIDHTVIVGRRLGISQTLIALLTVGAEYEELAVVIAAILQHRSPLALGNIIGSSISNILGAFSLGLLFQSTPSLGAARYDAVAKVYTALTLLVTTIVVGIIYFDVVNRVTGGVLVILFAIYIVSVAYAIYRGVTIPVSDSDDDDSDSDNDSGIGDDNGTATATETSPLLQPTEPTNNSPLASERRKRRSLFYHIFQLLIGLIALSLSGYILSHSASSIADLLNLSGTVFGVTILSFATTLPEKLVAVLSGARGHGSIMVASTAGSNIFLLTLCLGIIALTSGIPASPHAGGDMVVVFELAVAWASAAAFLLIVLCGGGRIAGVGLVGAYVAFLVLELTVFRR